MDKLNEQMRADAATKLKDHNLVFNHGNENNNFSVAPPFSDEFLFESICANRHATAIMKQIIGPRPILCWASSDIESLADVRQAVHSDAYADIRNFTFCVEMNIYLQDNTTETAAQNSSLAPMSSLRKIISPWPRLYQEKGIHRSCPHLPTYLPYHPGRLHPYARPSSVARRHAKPHCHPTVHRRTALLPAMVPATHAPYFILVSTSQS
jgi:hypothetical protein